MYSVRIRNTFRGETVGFCIFLPLCVCVRVRVCVHMCMRVCVCVFARARACGPRGLASVSVLVYHGVRH